jgi:hypothetical protein
MYSYMYEHSSYEYMHTHPIFMNIFKRLCRLDLEIYKVSHQEHIAIGTSTTTKRIISRKYVTLMPKLRFKLRWVNSTTRNITI